LKHHYLQKKKLQDKPRKMRQLLLRERRIRIRRIRARRRKARRIRMTMASHKLLILVHLKLFKGLTSNMRNSMKYGITEMKVRIINKNMMVNLPKLRSFHYLKKNIK